MIYYSQKIIPSNASEAIAQYITTFMMSSEYEMYKLGEDYYTTNNTEIMKRQMLVYAPVRNKKNVLEGAKAIPDPYKANNKIASAHLKILVDQKIQYSLGNGVKLGDKEKEVYDLLGERAKKKIKQIAKEASKKSIGWAYVYMDDVGAFAFLPVNPKESIPLYKTDNPEELGAFIRFYAIYAVDENGESGIIIRVEVWDDKEVTYYQEITEKSSDYRLCTEEEIGMPNPHTHIVKTLTQGEETKTTDENSWGKVPFIPMYNNDEQLYDLKPIKSLIDAYDFVMSDFANNLEDFQDIVWILKGYKGSDLEGFLKQLKEYKAVPVDENGDAKPVTTEIPHQARKTILDILKNDIFEFGMGVDVKGMTGGTVTNVLIKSQYANLDLKADEFETEVTDFMNKLIWFANRFQEMASGGVKIEEAEITFDRSLIVNEVELLKANSEQTGNVSKQTQLKNHRWVDKADEELEQMEEEGLIGPVVITDE